MTTRIHALICSTRPGRLGPAVGRWFHQEAATHAGAEVALVDLASFELPLFDEPRHPRLQQYEKPHTLRWSASVQAADAFVFVTPEYNHGPPPALVNALNYLSREWHYKPAAFLSYGGQSGGLRGVQQSKLIAATLRMVPILEGISVPFVSKQVAGDGSFSGSDAQRSAIAPMLDELCRVSEALRPLRAGR